METYLQDPRRQTWLVVSVAFAAFISALDGNVVSIALPNLARELNVPLTSASQVIVAYLLFMTASLPLVGKLGSLFGAKRLFLGGFLLFGLGSLVCGLAQTLNVLVAARVVQAIGGAALLATGYVLVAEHMPPDRRGTTMGLLGASSSIASIVGSPIGGFMTQAWGWSSIFLVNVPLSALALVIGWLYLPHDLPASEAEKKAPFDWLGLLFVTLSLIGISHGLNSTDLRGWSDRGAWIFLGAGVFFFALFIHQERRSAAPIIPGSVFGDRHITLAMVAVAVVMMILGCLTILGPFFLQNVHQLPPGKVGLIMTAPGVIMLIAAPVSGWLADRLSAERVSLLATVLLAISCLWLVFLGESKSVWLITAAFSLLGLSIGLFFPPNSSYVMSQSRRELRSVTSSTYNVIKSVGMLLGISVLGSISYAYVHAHHNGLPQTAEAKQAAMAMGFSAAMSGAVVLSVIAAVACALTLRRRKTETSTA